MVFYDFAMLPLRRDTHRCSPATYSVLKAGFFVSVVMRFSINGLDTQARRV